jgi:hypothetical protein
MKYEMTRPLWGDRAGGRPDNRLLRAGPRRAATSPLSQLLVPPGGLCDCPGVLRGRRAARAREGSPRSYGGMEVGLPRERIPTCTRVPAAVLPRAQREPGRTPNPLPCRGAQRRHDAPRPTPPRRLLSPRLSTGAPDQGRRSNGAPLFQAAPNEAGARSVGRVGVARRGRGLRGLRHAAKEAGEQAAEVETDLNRGGLG